MNPHDIPDDVQKFVFANLHSVEQLEVLLFLRRNSDRYFSAEAVNAILLTNQTSIAQRLEDLYGRKFVAKTKDHSGADVYRFSPNQDQRKAIDSLANYYATHRMRIIELIYSKPTEVVRCFADAFRIRKDSNQ